MVYSQKLQPSWLAGSICLVNAVIHLLFIWCMQPTIQVMELQEIPKQAHNDGQAVLQLQKPHQEWGKWSTPVQLVFIEKNFWLLQNLPIFFLFRKGNLHIIFIGCTLNSSIIHFQQGETEKLNICSYRNLRKISCSLETFWLMDCNQIWSIWSFHKFNRLHFNGLS